MAGSDLYQRTPTIVVQLAQGNFGALAFLQQCTQHTINVLVQLGIRGTDLYVLHSDLCGKDMYKVEKLLSDCPKEILVDACSRQDYSGRKLVEKYM